MDLIYPLISAVAEAFAKTTDKFNYQKNKILSNQLLFLLFATMAGGLLIFSIVLRQPLPIVTLGTASIVVFMIIVSFGQNFFDYVGLRTNNLSLREPISNFQPILAGFLAYTLFPSERNIKYIVAIIAGTALLYLSNSNRKLKLEFDRGTAYLFVGVVLSAVLTSVYKVALEHVGPFYLLLFRSAGVLLLVMIFMKPQLRGIKSGQATLAIGAGLLYIVGNLLQLYSIKHLGLNFTIMILALGPALIYIGSSLVLKEKVLPKQIAASAGLIVIIIWAIYL